MKKVLGFCCVAVALVTSNFVYAMTPEQAVEKITSAYMQDIPAQPTYTTVGNKATATMSVTSDDVSAKMTIIAQGVSETAAQKDSVHMRMNGSFTVDGDTYRVKATMAVKRSAKDMYFRLGSLQLRYAGTDENMQMQAAMGETLIAQNLAGKWIKMDLQDLQSDSDGATIDETAILPDFTAQNLTTQALNSSQDMLKKIIESVQGISFLTIGSKTSPDTYTVSLNMTWFEKLCSAFGESMPDDLRASIGHTKGNISTKIPEINLSMPHPTGKVGITINPQKTTIRATDSRNDPVEITVAKKPQGYGMSIYYSKAQASSDWVHLDASLALPATGKQVLKMNVLSNTFSMKFGIKSMLYDAAGTAIDMPQTYVVVDELMKGFSE